MPEPLLKAELLSKRFTTSTKEEIEVLRELNLEIAEAEFVAILGKSGSGKTTLVTLLSGLDSPTSGKILFNGEEITGWNEDRKTRFRRENVGLVFQTWELLPNLTALENVCLPLYPGHIRNHRLRSRARRLLTEVGLQDHEHEFPLKMSGGEQQRVALARALVSGPRLVFADEPTGNLDRENKVRVIDLLKKQRREHDTAVLLVTHDPEVADRADSVYRLEDGRLIAQNR